MRTKQLLVLLACVLTLLLVTGSASATFLQLTEQARLLADDGEGASHFGTAVAMHGDTMVIGAPFTHGDGWQEGAAYVFEKQNGMWQQVAQLTANDGRFWDWFGFSASIHEDVIVVGAPLADVGATADQGAAYVFTRQPAGTWLQSARLTAADGQSGDGFGYAIDIWDDTAVVGAWTADVGGDVDRGAAYVYRLDGAQWAQSGKLTAAEGRAEDRFGVAVAIHGSTILVGAHDARIAGYRPGAAYIFQRERDSWTEIATLLADDPGQDTYKFGESLDLLQNMAVVGAWGTTVDGKQAQGAAYVFQRHAGGRNNWSQTARLVASDGAAVDRFGLGVAVQRNGIVVGASTANHSGHTDAGAAYVFRRTRVGWLEVARLVASDAGDGDWFGSVVEVDGRTVAVGASLHDVGEEVNQGAVYVYEPRLRGIGRPLLPRDNDS